MQPPSPLSVPPQPARASSGVYSDVSLTDSVKSRPAGRVPQISVSTIGNNAAAAASATAAMAQRLGTNVNEYGTNVARSARVNAKAAKAAAKAAARSAQVPAHAREPRSPGGSERSLHSSMSRRRSLQNFMSPALAMSGLSRSASRLTGARTSGARASGSGRGRSIAANEGIALLKGGCVATKYTKRGVARATRFRLTEDETALTWEGNNCAVLKLGLA